MSSRASGYDNLHNARIRARFAMTCCIRYYRPGRRDAAGLLIAKKAELAIYKARLEAAGYVVLENIDISPSALEIPVTS